VARVCLGGLYCSNAMLPSLDVEQQVLAGAVTGVFAEVIVCWAKPLNASILPWDTCIILNTGMRLENYTRKNWSSLWLKVSDPFSIALW